MKLIKKTFAKCQLEQLYMKEVQCVKKISVLQLSSTTRLNKDTQSRGYHQVQMSEHPVYFVAFFDMLSL